MPNTREKLIELLAKKLVWGVEFAKEPKRIENEALADYLIANGVSFQEESHWATEQAFKNGYEKGKQDAVKWIPVTERLPEKWQNVLTFRTDKRIRFDFIGSLGVWYDDVNYVGEPITHWMPLPQPPKGE